MNEVRNACEQALADLAAGRTTEVRVGQYEIPPSELVEIALSVRTEAGSPARIAWRDGAVRYVLGASD